MPPAYAVLITDHRFPNLDPERSVLEPLGCKVLDGKCKTEEDIVAAGREADALLVLSARVGERAISGLPRLRLIVRYGVGVDKVDVEAATRRGVVVANLPDFCTEEVATHAAALVLACARKLRQLDEAVRGGRWFARDAEVRPIGRLSRATLGVVGFGRIGRLAAERLAPFFGSVLIHDPYQPPPPGALNGKGKSATLEELLENSDFVTLHVPLTRETRRMIGEKEIRRMKPTAFLVNVSRGGLVDEGALARALEEGRLGGAGLDVLEEEPPPAGHPLARLPNVILTPHAAWYSEEALVERQWRGAEEVARFLRGERPGGVVNPEVYGRAV